MGLAQVDDSLAAYHARGLLASQDFGGVEEIKLVDGPLVEEGAQGFGPAFHQEALDLAVPQLLQQGGERDPAGVGGQHQDLGAPGLKGADRILRRLAGGGHPGGGRGVQVQQLRRQGQSQTAVQDDPDGVLDRASGPPGGELGVVGQHRADPHDDGVHPVAQAVPHRPGGLARKPLAFAPHGGDLAVQGAGRLSYNPGPAGVDVVQPGFIQALGLGRQQPLMHLQPPGSQELGPAAGDLGIGVAGRNNHPAHPGRQDGLGAGRGAPLVVAGLQGDV